MKSMQVLLWIIIEILATSSLLYAQDTGEIRVDYHTNAISINVKDMDIKKVLYKIEEKTSIEINYPENIERIITFHIEEASLRDALEGLLFGYNYAFIYSGKDREHSVISEIYVFERQKASPGFFRAIRR